MKLKHNSEDDTDPRQLLAAISSAQKMAIEESVNSTEIFEAMLKEILEITESDFGFMGEVFHSQEGKPYLKTHALTNIAWNTETEALNTTHMDQGHEFRNLEALSGSALTTGKPVLSNYPGQDPSSGGLPPAYPPITAFLSIPIIKKSEMVGMIGIANSPGGYDEEVISFLEPLLSTCGTLINTFRSNGKRQKVETELFQALKDARYERGRADAILEAFGDPLCIQDRNFKVIYQNRTNMEALGDHRGELCYQAFENNTEICEGCALAKSFADGKTHRAERCVTRNGDTFYYDILASPLRDENGKIIAGIELARDITDHKKNTARLTEQMSLLALSSDIGTALTTFHNVRKMLEACCSLLVHHLGAAFARIWTLNHTEETLELQASAGMYTHINGPHGRIPVNNQTKIGAIAHNKAPLTTNSVIGDPQVSNQEWATKEGMVAFAGHPLLIEGRPIGVIGLFFRREIPQSTGQAIAAIATEIALGINRLQAEESLRRSNRALKILGKCQEALLHAATELDLLEKICRIITDSKDYRMAWVGYAIFEGEDKVVKPVAQTGFDDGYLETIQIRWDNSPEGHGPSGTAIRTGKPSIMQDIQNDPTFTPWRDKALSTGYASSLALPLIDSAGQAFGSLNIYSPEPEAFDEEEVKLFSDIAQDLSYGIGSFQLREEYDLGRRETLELKGRLRQAQKMEVIGTLAGGIAHDFNNILSAILGYSEIVKADLNKTSKNTDDIQQVINAGRRAADLVRQILTVSRQTAVERQPFKIQYIIKEALKLLRPSIPAPIEIRNNIDMNCPGIEGDPSEMHQVLMNLCTNAYHAMGDQNGLLQVGLGTVNLDLLDIMNKDLNLKPGAHILLTVKDSGPGIDKDILPKIFEPYFTTKNKGEGTGLGLAVVYAIVRGHKGDISVESSPGQGTDIKVYFPVSEKIPGITEELQEPATSVTGTERIMIVDDEESIAKMMKRSLEKLGYRTTFFSSPIEARFSFKQNPDAFDLIITDLYMPKITGTELSETILKTRPDIPIILCTGYSEKIDREYAKTIGVREFIYKPIDMRAFPVLLREVLDTSKRK